MSRLMPRQPVPALRVSTLSSDTRDRAEAARGEA